MISIPDSPFKAVMMPLSGMLGAAVVAGLFQFFLVAVHEYCSRRLSGGKMQDNHVVVNRPTGRMIRITKTTGRGSDYYGLCELCGGHMSECFTSRLACERRREDGSLYPDLAGVHVFAHKACIDKLTERDNTI